MMENGDGWIMRKKVKILVVEDEAAVAMLMAHLLSRAGCCVVTSWRPEHIFEQAKVENFDLIILDINMPGMSGFEVCEQLRADPHLQNTPVIFVSGSCSNEKRQRAEELNAVDFIAKPFRSEDFVGRVMLQVRSESVDNLETPIASDESLEANLSAAIA